MCKRAGLPHLVGMCAARLSRKLDEAVRALPRRTLWAICAILRAFPGVTGGLYNLSRGRGAEWCTRWWVCATNYDPHGCLR